ncbi:hypothetical protein [Jeotgalibacillus soli]|uniref:hypothetical protein n=1 Tax=Jeotgalibacillus soli TaxID=889306 RepID=UPI001F22C4C0|nr:hypothetical protein [Jeotgalibacillus soli]
MTSGKQILKAFGFDADEEPKSIYPFSPVYYMESDRVVYIIKRTQKPLGLANGLMNYLKALKEAGVNIVAPVHMLKENLQVISEDVFAIYPFINGNEYSGEDDEIIESKAWVNVLEHIYLDEVMWLMAEKEDW